MALPKLNKDLVYNTKLPLDGKKIEYRPFFVKEEKILMMALEGKDAKEQIEAVKNVVDNCTFNKLEVGEMGITDLEWLFLQLRIKSKGEVVTLHHKCKNKISVENAIAGEQPEYEDCGHVNKFDIDLTKVKVKKEPSHKSIIKLVDDIGVKMKYPNLNMLDSIEGDIDVNSMTQNMDMLMDSIESIFEGESVHLAKDIDRKELEEFIDSMTDDQFEELKNFFKTLPKLQIVVDVHCAKCRKDEKVTIEGIRNFFG